MTAVKKSPPARSLDYRLPVDRIPAQGLSIRIEPGAEARAGLANALGLIGLDHLQAELEIHPAGHAAYRIRGSLSASLTQECVVSLEPVTSDIGETIDVEFRPAPSEGFGELVDYPGSADDPDPFGETDLEAYDGVALDLGALVAEILASAIDPYPRKPGVEFVWSAGGADGPTDKARSPESPFAKLAAIAMPRGRRKAGGE